MRTVIVEVDDPDSQSDVLLAAIAVAADIVGVTITGYIRQAEFDIRIARFVVDRNEDQPADQS